MIYLTQGMDVLFTYNEGIHGVSDTTIARLFASLHAREWTVWSWET
jgi:hypothetical protein